MIKTTDPHGVENSTTQRDVTNVGPASVFESVGYRCTA
jgi:hypothetical protein